MNGSEQQKPVRAAIYIRVSTEDQTKGHSPGFQREDTLRAATERDGCVVKAEHIIDDSGSGSTADRPGWQKLMAIARRREIDAVYFWKLDRMMRDEYLFYHTERDLQDLGVELRFATQNLADPFTRAIQVAVAAEERRRILERTRRGQRAAAVAGKWVGTPPYGYVSDPTTQKLVILPEEARWVTKFFEWLVYERCSLKEIARRANNLQIPTKNLGMNTKRKHAKAWWVRTIGRMLTNETYTGTAHYGKHRTRHKDLRSWLDPRRLNPQEQWVTMVVPAIVSPELFQAALKQLIRNRDFAARNTKQTYLFSKLIHCGKCGFRFKGTFARPRTSNSVGSKHYVGILPPRTLRITSKRCRYCGSIAESRLMPIWEALKVTLAEPAYVYDRLTAYLASKSTKGGIAERATEIDRELEHLEKQQSRIKVAYLETQSLDEKEFKVRLRENGARCEVLIQERAKLDLLQVSEKEKADRVVLLGSLYRRIKDSLEEASYQTMSETLHLLVNRIDLYPEQDYARVQFNFPAMSSRVTEDGAAATTIFAGQRPEPQSHKTDYLRDTGFGLRPAIEFTLTVKVPLITTEEWREAAAPANIGGPRNLERAAQVMAELAVRKARDLFM